MMPAAGWSRLEFLLAIPGRWPEGQLYPASLKVSSTQLAFVDQP